LKDYIEQYRILHKEKPQYGKTSVKFLGEILEIIDDYKIQEILDYGCGKSDLLDKLKEQRNIKIYKYDPAIEQYSRLPHVKINLLICTDVLQHIPIFDLSRVLKEISNYNSLCFFHIRCTFYHTLLPNGEPANVTVRSKKWWLQELGKYFNNIKTTFSDKDSVSFLVS
jgi:hypothetical protein